MQIDFAEVRGDQVFIILCLSQYKKMVQKIQREMTQSEKCLCENKYKCLKPK